MKLTTSTIPPMLMQALFRRVRMCGILNNLRAVCSRHSLSLTLPPPFSFLNMDTLPFCLQLLALPAFTFVLAQAWLAQFQQSVITTVVGFNCTVILINSNYCTYLYLSLRFMQLVSLFHIRCNRKGATLPSFFSSTNGHLCLLPFPLHRQCRWTTHASQKDHHRAHCR